MNKKRIYENVIILRGTFTEEDYKKALEKIKEYLAKYEIKKIEEIGKKKLAYEVDKNNEGYYIIIELKATEQEVFELERFYRINDNVLKFLIVKKYKR